MRAARPLARDPPAPPRIPARYRTRERTCCTCPKPAAPSPRSASTRLQPHRPHGIRRHGETLRFTQVKHFPLWGGVS